MLVTRSGQERWSHGVKMLGNVSFGAQLLVTKDGCEGWSQVAKMLENASWGPQLLVPRGGHKRLSQAVRIAVASCERKSRDVVTSCQNVGKCQLRTAVAGHERWS